MFRNEIGRFRLLALRALFLLTFLGLAPNAWQELLTHADTWDPFYGVAVSFWAALSLLAGVGIFWPKKLLALLVLQLTYKAAWLGFVGLPLYQQGELTGAALELAYANGIGVVLDLMIIPWGYVIAQLIRKHERRALVS